MPAKKRLYEKLLNEPWDATHFTPEECKRVVRKVMAEQRMAAEARRQRRLARRGANAPTSEA